MLDIFPFLRLNGKTAEEQIKELESYLIQFKEILEFSLGNITEENLSPELFKKLGSTSTVDSNGENVMSHTSAKILTVAEVCNSKEFKEAIDKEKIRSLLFSINFENGHLEYTSV